MRRIILALGAVILFAGIGFAATLYQTTPAPKITYPYYSGIKVGVDDVVSTDTMVDLTLTDTSTIYSSTIPDTCIGWDAQARTAVDVLYSDTSGGFSTNYRTIKSGTSFRTPIMFGTTYSGTIYFKCPGTAGVVMEIIYFKKP